MGNDGNELSTLNMLLGPGSVFRMSSTIRFAPAVLLQAAEHLFEKGVIGEGSVIYDPFCGNGTILYGLAVYFPGMFQKLYGSDFKKSAVMTTARNMLLTVPENLAASIDTLSRDMPTWQISSKKARRRLENLECLLNLYAERGHRPTDYDVLQGNVLEEGFADSLIGPGSVDALLCDPPYSRACPWYGHDGSRIESYPLGKSLQFPAQYLAPGGKIAVFSERGSNPDLTGLRLIDRKEIPGNHLDRELLVLENPSTHSGPTTTIV
ncbi:hypothetical protein HYU10_03765 [Candidatus Woesearchaeota archaeon]|nr:hypothetical protein [Candidatus Woesearchaeota archaeon]MBI2661684.1 hypothetical protein [Candidatus Woesearchaeota archaeon]